MVGGIIIGVFNIKVIILLKQLTVRGDYKRCSEIEQDFSVLISKKYRGIFQDDI